MTNKLKSADLMPGNTGLPPIGNTIGALSQQELFYWNRYQQHGKIFKVSMPGLFNNIACLIGPEANRLVFKDETDRLSSRLGKGLPKNKEFQESKIDEESIQQEDPGNVGTNRRN